MMMTNSMLNQCCDYVNVKLILGTDVGEESVVRA